jgi:hypothetical protein
VSAWGIQFYRTGFEDNFGRGANVLLSGGTDMLGDDDGGALRVSCGAGPMCVGGRFLLCGGR